MMKPLTKYQVEILTLSAEGMSCKEIAARLGKGNRSIEGVREKCKAKLGARNLMHAVAIAISQGIIMKATGDGSRPVDDSEGLGS